MKKNARSLINDAIEYGVNNKDTLVIDIIGASIGDVGDGTNGVLETEVELSKIWEYAESIYGDDIPEIFINFMEEKYGESGEPWDIPTEYRNDLECIIDYHIWEN